MTGPAAKEAWADASRSWRESGRDISVVTFTLPVDRPDGKADPVGILPDGRTYGIVDRAYRLVVAPGETWVVGINPVGRALFLVPLQRVGLDELAELRPDLLSLLAAHLAEHRPDLVLELASHLVHRDAAPADTSTTAAPTPWRDAVEAARLRILDAQADLARARSDLEDLARPAERKALPLWLADANLFINAARWGWPSSNDVLDVAGLRFRLATTRAIRDELLHGYRLPLELEIVDTGEPDAALAAAAKANATALGKTASRADLSLLSAARSNPAVQGIITDDGDLHRMHPATIVGRPIECLTARQFLERHRALVPGAKP